MADSEEERLWESGWEGHSMAQRRRLARLTFIEKLEWLESAQQLVDYLGRSARGTADRARRGRPNPLGRNE